MTIIALPDPVSVRQDETSTSTDYHCTTEQALAFVRRQPAGTRFYARVRVDAPIDGKPDMVYQDGLFSTIRIGRPDALRLIKDLLSPALMAKGARLPLGVYESKDSVRGQRPYRAAYIG